LYATPYEASGPDVDVITPILISPAAWAGAMLGARTASEIAATTKRFSELLLIYVLLIELIGPRSSDLVAHQSRGCRGLLPSY
jgi:uncharacterized membrane protein YfcA